MVMVTDEPTYTIGYALLPNKAGSIVQPSLVALAAERGMRLVAVDASRPLTDQGPFHLLIHKRYDQPWRAQLEAFCALHPTVPVVDPPAAVDRLLDRATMLDVVPDLISSLASLDEECSLGVPSQVTVRDATALASTDLRFPLIAKPLAVDGSAVSHAMSLVYRHEGLLAVRTPVVLQEFVNHGGVLFKVYVVGGRATCVRRRSLPDVPRERLADLGQDAAVPFANVSNLQVDPDADDKDAAEMPLPPASFVDEVSRGLRRALGLHLFNFDLIRDEGRRYRHQLLPGVRQDAGLRDRAHGFLRRDAPHQPSHQDLNNSSPNTDNPCYPAYAKSKLLACQCRQKCITSY
ncbi:unnamed protein product [Alopecurus aequalis]